MVTIPLLKRQFGQLITETPYDQAWVSAIRACLPVRARSWDDKAHIWRFDPDHYNAVLFITQHHFGMKIMDSTGGFNDVEQEMTDWKAKWDIHNTESRSRSSERKHEKRGRGFPGTGADSPRQILHVTDDAPDYVILAAFRAMASKNHPDAGGDLATMVKINEAYQSLKEAGQV